MDYVIADLHFGHAAIIQYENRPFASVEEMDEALVRNWNAVVTREDSVWVLGDVSLCGAGRTRALVSRLKGEKHLVIGNHDEGRSESFWLKCGFAAVYKGPVEFGGYVLSHEPLPVPTKLNIHGHAHGATEGLGRLHRCVSVEVTGYRPVPLHSVLRAYIEAENRSKETPVPFSLVAQGFRELCLRSELDGLVPELFRVLAGNAKLSDSLKDALPPGVTSVLERGRPTWNWLADRLDSLSSEPELAPEDELALILAQLMVTRRELS